MSAVKPGTAPARSPRARLGGQFWRLWWANAVNCLGDGAFLASMPLLAVTVTKDPFLVSVVSAAGYLPWLVVSLPAGVIVDRHDRVSLMWSSQSVQAVVVAGVAILAAVHDVDLPLLVVASFLLGSAQVVVSNAAQSVLPQFVPREQLQRANSNQYTVQTVCQSSLGPPIGSLLFGLAAALPFGVDAGSFVVSAGLLASLPKADVPGAGRQPMRTAVAEGLLWLLRHRLLRTLALLLAVNTFGNQMGFSTIVLLATVTLHLSVSDYGLLLVGVGVGSVLGGLVNTRIAKRLGPVPAFIVALAVNAAVYTGMGLAPNGVTLGMLIALCGMAITVSSVVTVSLRQQIVPNELLGRVNSVFRMMAWGLMPLGALAGGVVAQQLGLRAPFVIAGVLRAVVLIAVVPILIIDTRALAAAEADESPAA